MLFKVQKLLSNVLSFVSFAQAFVVTFRKMSFCLGEESMAHTIAKVRMSRPAWSNSALVFRVQFLCRCMKQSHVKHCN